MDNSLEERLLILFLVLFSMFMIVYRPNYGENFDSSIEIVSDNREDIIIKQNNVVKKVSKVCSHMGCILNLNKDTKKLMCPCHGSEFGLDGTVLEGPARTNLDVMTLSEKYTNYQNRKKLEW